MNKRIISVNRKEQTRSIGKREEKAEFLFWIQDFLWSLDLLTFNLEQFWGREKGRKEWEGSRQGWREGGRREGGKREIERLDLHIYFKSRKKVKMFKDHLITSAFQLLALYLNRPFFSSSQLGHFKGLSVPGPCFPMSICYVRPEMDSSTASILTFLVSSDDCYPSSLSKDKENTRNAK